MGYNVLLFCYSGCLIDASDYFSIAVTTTLADLATVTHLPIIWNVGHLSTLPHRLLRCSPLKRAVTTVASITPTPRTSSSKPFYAPAPRVVYLSLLHKIAYVISFGIIVLHNFLFFVEAGVVSTVHTYVLERGLPEWRCALFRVRLPKTVVLSHWVCFV